MKGVAPGEVKKRRGAETAVLHNKLCGTQFGCLMYNVNKKYTF